MTLDDMLEATRLLKRPVLCRIEIGENMLGFVVDLLSRAAPKPRLDDSLFGGIPVVDNDLLPAGWARGVDQDGGTLFLLTREHFYDFAKVLSFPYQHPPRLAVLEPPQERFPLSIGWWLRRP